MDEVRPGPARGHALVTGGSGGIGAACARALVARGYEVLLVARRKDRLAEVAAQLGARYATADCADEAAVEAALAGIDELDVVVHASGILDGTFVREESAETFDRVIRANLRSAFVVTKAVLGKLRTGGRLVYISSTAGLKGQPGRASYSASKAALNAFAQALAAEVERDGINVHLVTPAPVDTAMLENVTFAMHTLRPEDVADAVGFLVDLAPGVVVREVVMRSMVEGPLAPEPVVPAAASSTAPLDRSSRQVGAS
jgi:NAD(P)-dependent dehydrogenase (short-subunit alcohol dehydrogenase family)